MPLAEQGALASSPLSYYTTGRTGGLVSNPLRYYATGRTGGLVSNPLRYYATGRTGGLVSNPLRYYATDRTWDTSQQPTELLCPMTDQGTWQLQRSDWCASVHSVSFKFFYTTHEASTCLNPFLAQQKTIMLSFDFNSLLSFWSRGVIIVDRGLLERFFLHDWVLFT